MVRGAYDPAAARYIEDAKAQGVTPPLLWSNVGPAASEASWDAYRHDGAVSVTWAMTGAPRGEVHSNILAQAAGTEPAGRPQARVDPVPDHRPGRGGPAGGGR